MITAIISYFCLSVFCTVLFLIGYFPINQTELIIQEPPNHILNQKLNIKDVYKPEIDRLVFIIIDALREDFINEENMPYLFREHDCKMLVKVEAPTVTLPRIKAITTGGIPQFIDIVLNLGATTKCNDSFLHRAENAGKKMIFYGDNTWLKIYPDLFLRSDGVTSFYVNDFTEVDNNITRHIDEEMLNSDWDIMFLHYLGLDHIGHVRGPFSNLIQVKLQEMDDVVETIHKNSQKWDKNTLIIITGDHGMKDSGGHGGTTYAETHVPLISFGIPCYASKIIAQTDIPTTLSALFGIQMPATGIGKIIPPYFADYSIERYLYILRYNLIILQRKSYICKSEFENASQLHYDFLNHKNSGEDIGDMYQICLDKINKEIVESSVQQNFKLLILSLLIIINSLIAIIIYYLNSKFKLKTNLNMNKTTFINALLIIIVENRVMVAMIIIYTIICILNNILKLLKLVRKHHELNIRKLYILGPLFHQLLLVSSSFIEEEHQILFYLTGTTILVLSYISFKKSIKHSLLIITLFICLRFSRRLNSVGDQWASYPDFSDWLLLEDNFLSLQMFYATSLMLIFIFLLIFFKKPRVQLPVFALIIFIIFIYKIHYMNNLFLAQFIWFLILISSIPQFIFNKKMFDNILISWICIITLLLRPYNTILLPIAIFGSQIFIKHVDNIEILTVIQIWFGYTLFFCQGHSHSIASIDLAPGYIGLSSYVPSIVFLLTLFHTYAFPILTYLLLLRKHSSNANNIWAVSIICRLTNLIVICLVNFILRDHLFVWSVFAPKLLIETAHTFLLFILISIFYTFKCLYYFINKRF